MLKKLSYVGWFVIHAFLVVFRLWQNLVRKNALPKEVGVKPTPEKLKQSRGKSVDSLYLSEADSIHWK